MTEHFTRGEAASFAKSVGLITSNVGGLTDTLNAAIDYKLKEWGAQMEHIAWKHCDFDHAVFQKDWPHWPEQGWVKLYTRALPAQPAQDVNAVLLEALQWIARVNAMDYEYQGKAREALAKYAATRQEQKSGC